jgi:hypothetical protein
MKKAAPRAAFFVVQLSVQAVRPRDHFEAAEAGAEAAGAAGAIAGAGAGAGAAAGAGAGAGASSFLPQAARAKVATRVARTSDLFMI